MPSSDTTTIGTLRLRSAGEDTPSLRLSLSSMLRSADLKPRGVPPSAILIVRSMRDPLPGRFAPGQGMMRVDTEWERAVQSSLSGIYRQAARPVGGFISPSASAVLFLDEGEMLACLALELSRQEAKDHWWWKLVMRLPSQSSDGIKHLFCSRAMYLPAALRYLSDWGQAGAVVSSLSSQQAMEVVAALGKEYGIADLVSNISEVRSDAEIGKQRQIDGQERDGLDELPHSRQTDVKAPWERWLAPEIAPQGKEKKSLLGLGLSLHHEPAVVRRGAFLRGFRKWWTAQVEPFTDNAIREVASNRRLSGTLLKASGEKEDVLDKPLTELKAAFAEKKYEADKRSSLYETSSPEAADEKFEARNKLKQEYEPPPVRKNLPDDADVKVAAITGDVSARSAQEHISPAEPSVKDDIKVVISQNQSSTDQKDIAGHRTANDGEALARQESSIAYRIKDISPSGLPGTPEAGQEEATSAEHKGFLEEGVETQLGGVLYLVNLMTKLDLPACFEEECGLASKIGAWGILEVIARALLAEDENISEDPLWNALAKLGGRDQGELPGDDFHCSDVFALPPAWLNHVAKDSAYYWAADDHRLRLWCENYLLVNCPREGSAPDLLARNQLTKYLGSADQAVSERDLIEAPLETILGPLVEGLNPDLREWLAMVMPFIRFYLKHALNLDENDLEKNMLLCKGRLYVTLTHVDLVLSLDDVSMQVRCAGLDRDPGWVADFGRVVLFHFE